MALIGEWRRRLGYLLRRSAIEEELRREMEGHRELMDDPRRFGNTLRLRDQSRDAWGWTWLDDLMGDFRVALRSLRHSAGFAVTATLTLALGVGANIGMFTFVNSLLLRPLYDHPDEVVGIYSRSRLPPGEIRGMSFPNYLDLRQGTTDVFASLAAYSTVLAGVDAGDGARRTLVSSVTAGYFDVFNHPLMLGRPFTWEEQQPGVGIRVAIISSSLWQRRGTDRGIVGQSIRINGQTFTVIGVTAKGFTGAGIPGPDVWLPYGAHAAIDMHAGSGGPIRDARDAHELSVVGRLRAGVSFDTALAPLATVATRLERAFPASNTGYTFAMSEPSRLLFLPGPGSAATTRMLASMLMIMPLIVLLVTCLNLANLLLARGHVRRRELAIRSSLGGGRWRLIRQLLTEAVLLAAAGSVLGVLLSSWATEALLASLHPVLPAAFTLPELDLDLRVLLGTIGFALLASVGFGLWPAWQLTTRITATALERHVSEDRCPRSALRIGNALVVGQVSLSLLLIACGGLFLMSATAAATADPGFQLERGLLAEVDASLAGYDHARANRLYVTLVDRLRALPGVEAATIASSFPFTGFGDSRLVAPAGSTAGVSGSVDAVFMVVGREYARTLGFHLLGGRDFTDAELLPASPAEVAIIDVALAQRLWPGESALGRLIHFLDAEASDARRLLRVVGIVPALPHSFGNPQPFPHVYVPLAQHQEGAMILQLRIAVGQDSQTVLATAARVIRDLDERVPVIRLQTWREHLDGSLLVWLYRAGARVCSVFAGIALFLAVIGVYGVKSYVVARRTREFGIRIAVGAPPRALLWQVLREDGRLTIIGIIIGLLLAVGAGQLLQHMLYGIKSVELIVLITAPLILLAASLLASFFPARRATRVHPTLALRAE